MEDLQFPQPYQHSHKPVIDINKVLESDRTFGQRAADWVVMISENRQNERDRLEHLACQDRALIRIHEQLKTLEARRSGGTQENNGT